MTLSLNRTPTAEEKMRTCMEKRSKAKGEYEITKSLMSQRKISEYTKYIVRAHNFLYF